MNNKVGSACMECMHYVRLTKDLGFCAYNGQCYGTQVNTPTDSETRRTGRIWGVDGKIDGQGRVHLPRKLAKRINVAFGDTVHFEMRDGENYIRVYSGKET